MRPASLLAYGLAARALSPLARHVLNSRAARGKEDPARLDERLGRPSRPRPVGALVWLHGASVGESLSLLPVIDGLIARRPGLIVLVTSGTVASAELMAKRLPMGAIHQFAPLDTPGAARRFMAHWRPDLAIFVESELWPTLLATAKAQGARLALISARLSAASVRGWKRLPGAARTVLGGFDLVMAQDEPCAQRLAALGARDDGRLNLKLVGAPLPVDATALDAMQADLAGRPLLLAASTHPGEDQIVLDAFAALSARPDRPLLVIAPRHPVRGGEVVEMARARGFVTSRRSLGEVLNPQVQVLVADTLGELGLWFKLARTALVAGSLADHVGGHNPLEPARLSCPFVTGPFVENWAGVFAAFEAVDAFVTVCGASALSDAFVAALDHPEAGQARAARALALSEVQGGALKTALDRLDALLEARS